MKVLFITELYCDGKPEMGVTNSEHNIYGSASHCKDFQYDRIHYDELSLKGLNVDNEIVKKFDSYLPDLVFILPMAFMDFNPSIDTVKYIHSKVPLVYIWPDAWGQWAQNYINQLGDDVDMHIVWDTFMLGTKYNNKILFTPVPQDSTLYYPGEQIIDVSFIGSMRQPGRATLLEELNKRGITPYVTGGQRENRLSIYDYALLIRQSKISLNTSWTALQGVHQMKGRVMEILLSKSMMLESANPITTSFFKNNEDIVQFNSFDECAEKIRYYLKHEEERLKIAEHGYQSALNYKDELYWRKIIKTINGIRPINSFTNN